MADKHSKELAKLVYEALEEKKAQDIKIINIEGEIFLDHIIGFLLQFPHAIPQFLTSVCDLAHCIRILDDPVPEILQIRQGVFCFLQGIP